MKIPKYIETALNRRSKAARSFIRNDYILTKFIQEIGIGDKIYTDDYNCGSEALYYHDESCERIRQAIIDKEQ